MTANTNRVDTGKGLVTQRNPKRICTNLTTAVSPSRDSQCNVVFSDPRVVELVTGSINDRILTIRKGLPGDLVKEVVSGKPVIRKMFIRGLQIDQSNASRLYRRKRLDQHQSEVISDVLRIHDRACQVFEDERLVDDWLQADVPALLGRPIDLMDTTEGRSWVLDSLERIDTGDFS